MKQQSARLESAPARSRSACRGPAPARRGAPSRRSAPIAPPGAAGPGCRPAGWQSSGSAARQLIHRSAAVYTKVRPCTPRLVCCIGARARTVPADSNKPAGTAAGLADASSAAAAAAAAVGSPGRSACWLSSAAAPLPAAAAAGCAAEDRKERHCLNHDAPQSGRRSNTPSKGCVVATKAVGTREARAVS